MRSTLIQAAPSILLVGGILLVGRLLLSGIGQLRRRRTWRPAAGRIVELRTVRTDTVEETARRARSARCTFVTDQGREVDGWSELFRTPGDPLAGEPVQVWFDPGDPARFALRRPRSAGTVVVIYAALLLLFAGVAAATIPAVRSWWLG